MSVALSVPPSFFWLRLAILIGAGVAVALQIGKVPAALPFVKEDLSLSLVQTGWVVSIFALVAAGFAAFIGALADRIGHLRAALCGMLVTATAALLGSQAQDGTMLLTLRVIEGFGYLLTSTSIPTLILRFAPENRRAQSLALWGLFVPIGSFAMMVISGPLLEFWDWRVLWIVTALMIGAACLPVWALGRHVPPAKGPAAPAQQRILRASLRPAPLLGAATFAVYASNYFIVTGFLPLTFVGDNGASPLLAASLGAIVIASNALGILAGGWLLGRDVRPSTLITVGGCVMALCGAVVFATSLPVPVRVTAAFVMVFFGGLVPSSLFAAIPRLAGNPSAVSTISGLLAQGSGIGQLTGPPLAAALVAATGIWWSATPVIMVLALFTAGLGLVLRRFT